MGEPLVRRDNDSVGGGVQLFSQYPSYNTLLATLPLFSWPVTDDRFSAQGRCVRYCIDSIDTNNGNLEWWKTSRSLT